MTQSLVHNMDRAAWILKEQMPSWCFGLGGRSASFGDGYGDMYDHHTVVYEYASGTRVYALCRTQNECYGNSSDIIMGTKGQCDLGKLPHQRRDEMAFQGSAQQPLSRRTSGLHRIDPQRQADQQRVLYGRQHDVDRVGPVGLLHRPAAEVGRRGQVRISNSAPPRTIASFDTPPPSKPDATANYPLPKPGLYDAPLKAPKVPAEKAYHPVAQKNGGLQVKRAMHTTLLAIALAAGVVAAPPEKQPAAEKTRVLIVTGGDTAHDWKKTSPVVRATLEQDPRIEARIVDDPEFLASPLVADYDVILLEFYNRQPLRHQAEAQKNLAQLVQQGKGLVVLHFSCGAFSDWPEYADLAGRVWDRKTTHDPRGPFNVKIIDRQHPITRGMEDFPADDELYVCLTGDKKMDVLATARSKVTGKEYPMALVMSYGKGRVFNTPLGHDGKAIAMPGTAKLLQRGVLGRRAGTVNKR